MKPQGFLAIWCEMSADDLANYRNWLTLEHIADRITSPGFLGMRLCTAVDNERAHFFLYATESPTVLKAPPYLHILNNPSPWTKQLMVKFGPFDRAAGERVLKIGRGFGSHLLVSRVRGGGAVNPVVAREALKALIDLPDTVGVRWMRNHRDTTGLQSAEKQMRKGVEGDFDHLLVVEALSEAGTAWAHARLTSAVEGALPGATGHDSRIYRVIYGDAPHEGDTASADV